MTGQRPPGFRPPEAYVHGFKGPVVLVPARVCAWLERHAELQQVRVEARGRDAEVDSVLVAMRTAAMAWRATAIGSVQAAEPEELAKWLSVPQIANYLDVTDRAIRHAIADGRLKATRDGTRWKVAQEDFIHYQTARAA